MAAVTPTCNPKDQARLRPQRSCSKNMSALLAMSIERLGDDAHIGDSGLSHCIHYRRKRPERDIFISANENGLVLRIADFCPQLCPNLVNVDGIVSQEDALL